mmetsp:Transcript_36100/g.83150  ORF Transcript_36100/g.83150 Transcript_36100/m.83150 type:complete len:238 (-) Transcript_36100:651-1364(-)
MPRAVHRLQHPLLLLHVQAIHVVLVVLVVARRKEASSVIHVRRHNFREAPEPVFRAHEVYELVVNPGTEREPKTAARRHHRMEHEELLRLANVPVISFGSFLLELLVLLEELVIGESNAVESLQRVQVLIAQPVCCRILCHQKGLGAVRVRQVGPAAQVNQISTAVATRESTIRHLVRDELNLERVLLEELQGLGFGHHAALKGLRLLADLLRVALNRGEVVVIQLPVTEEAVVVES